MKNTENYKLISTIAMELDEFKTLIEELTGGVKTVDYEFGAYITGTDKDNGEHFDIEGLLSEYFDVQVSSWHSDTCDYPMVFICY